MSWKLKSKIQKNILVEYRYAERKKLDMGMGQGRNSVFLAMKGWEVTGFDISDEGLAVARKNAERAGVKLNAIRETDEEFDYGSDRWNLIVFMYEPFPLTSAAYVERLSRSMKSGGLIVIESTADHIAVSDWSGRAKTRIVRMVAEKRLYH